MKPTPQTPKSLVIDVGGSNLKIYVAGRDDRWKIPSGPNMTPGEFLAALAPILDETKPDRVSIGFPSVVSANRILEEPQNLGGGWTHFDPAAALALPCRVVNDAAMQALGAYSGRGRMLFLGLGTGLGTALVDDAKLIPLELGRFRHSRSTTLEDAVSKKALKKLGVETWERTVWEVVDLLRSALLTDSIALGGGNASKLSHVPEGVRIGSNRDAFAGGLRLWQPA